MKINKNHRESLLNELQKATEDLSIQKKCFDKEEDESLKNWFEISMFLAQKKIKLIEKSIVENEINF